MLEIKNLTKIYKNKVGTDVLALDDISLKFPETGMVFLLGKSGSGKSTLLNVIGGLDVPSKGEVIVKGRSSKDFSQSDFDSYRNTYVGFVFQEYNVLDEFTTYENIALAIELQDKVVDDKKVNDLLDRVDLSGYAKRKPNTLSGGQRQRIAIARALVKNPEIILADEPTGALDSQTGEQVLDTLKKLSNDTLVIVVSHDREFAEKYADRIIELKDGKVINDITKSKDVNNKTSNDDTLLIKNAKELTDSDFDYIKKFILSSEGDIVLSKNDSDIELIRSNKENNVSNTGEFINTKVDALEIKDYNPDDTKFIRSKLPFKHAFRIGISSMKNKRFRLFMTVFLVSIAFVLFGLLSTMMFYSTENTFKDTLAKSNYKFLKLGKVYKLTNKYYNDGELTDTYSMDYDASFTEKEYNTYRSKYGKELFYGVEVSTNYSTEKNNRRYYKNSISYVAYLESDNPLRNKIVGEYPKNDNEIVLSTYTVDGLIDNGFYDENKSIVRINSRDEVIGKTIRFIDGDYKIVGYFDSGKLSSKYDKLKTEGDMFLSSEFDSYIKDELHTLMFVSESSINKYNSNADYYFGSEGYVKIKLPEGLTYDGSDAYNYLEYKDYLNDSVVKLSEYNEMDDNSAVVSARIFGNLVLSKYGACVEENCEEINNLAQSLVHGSYLDNEGTIHQLSKDESINNIKRLISLVDINAFTFKFCESFEEVEFGIEKKLNIVGIHFNSNMNFYVNKKNVDSYWKENKSGLRFYSESFTKFEGEPTRFMKLFVPFDGSSNTIDHFYNIFVNKKYDDKDTKLVLSNYIVENVSTIEMLVKILYQVFLYGGIVLCLFAILLFSNFINISITHKLREIGILRAVGARGIDVFKIFFAESLFISFMCLAISIAGTLSIANMINQVVSFGVGVSIFVFGPVSFIFMLLLGLITSIFATYLPVLKASKKKPVDLIRSL